MTSLYVAPKKEMKQMNLLTKQYDLNQISYDYTLEVRNRFKGLDLIECLQIWMEVHDIVQEAVINIIPKKNKCKKAK